jgi:hypothetical protein
MSKRMVEIAGSYEGFIGIEPARNLDGSGVAVILAFIRSRTSDPLFPIRRLDWISPVDVATTEA